MRILTLTLLLASAVSVPAFADRGDRGDRGRSEVRDNRGQQMKGYAGPQAAREVAVQRSEDRPQARERVRQGPSGDNPRAGGRGNWTPAQAQAQAQAAPVAPIVQAQASTRTRGNPAAVGRTWQGRGGTVGSVPAPSPQQSEVTRARTYGGDQNGGNRRYSGRNAEGQREVNRGVDPRRDGNWNNNNNNQSQRRDGNWNNNNNNQGSRGTWSGNNQSYRGNGNWNNNNNNHHNWNNGWRGDKRYNWQGYRNQYRSHYRQPRYYNPYGNSYHYRRFGIGIYLNSLYFGSRYWLSDPWEYRLPPAPYGCRWVRYYDDVLLVDTRTGYVVDAIHGFFW